MSIDVYILLFSTKTITTNLFCSPCVNKQINSTYTLSKTSWNLYNTFRETDPPERFGRYLHSAVGRSSH